jgi:endonuclease/exonuclease/phosphatase family metal-dependent hydrolase
MKGVLGFLLLTTTLSLQAAITIGAYNIRNFDYDDRYRIRTNKTELHTILKSLNADVLSVEEINNTAEFEKFIAAKMPGYDTALSRCGGAHGQKLGFIFNTSKIELLSFNEDLSITEPGTAGSCDAGTRPLAIGLFQIKATKQKFYGITAHLKSGSDAQSRAKRFKQYEIMKKVVQDLRSKSGIKDFFIAGDLNTTDYVTRGGDYTALTKVVSDLGMKNLSSGMACSAYWWGGSDDGIETPSLLDHVIVTPGLLKTSGSARAGTHCQKVTCRQVPVKELGISYESVSDHCPVTATIQ